MPVEMISAFDDINHEKCTITTEYDREKHRHYVSLYSKTIDDLQMLFDTGSDSTVISKSSLAKSLEISSAALNDKLVAYKEKTVGFADGSSIKTKMYPCCILNATIGEMKIPKFYFMVLENDSSDLLGCDFIDYCVVTKDKCGSFILSDFDFKKYEIDFGGKSDYRINSYLDSVSLNYFGGD